MGGYISSTCQPYTVQFKEYKKCKSERPSVVVAYFPLYITVQRISKAQERKLSVIVLLLSHYPHAEEERSIFVVLSIFTFYL